MKLTKEQKLAFNIADSVEEHWFNSSIIGHILSDQPHYTVDRIMELIAHIIKHNAERYKGDLAAGEVSEGLILANELQQAITQIKEYIQFNNLKLPREAKQIIQELPDVQSNKNRYDWSKHDSSNFLPFDVNAVLM